MINFDPVDFSGFGFRLYQGKNYEAMQKYEPKFSCRYTYTEN